MPYLKLKRRPGESIQIGEHVTVTLVELSGGQALLGIEAPKEVTILRDNAVAREPKPKESPR